MATGIRRVEARQAQTLRFFRRLRLLRPPPSSKPQRLLASTGPEPTLAADSVLGARHQLPDVVSMNGPLTHNHPRPPMRISTRTSATAPACTTTAKIQHGSATTTILRGRQSTCNPAPERTEHPPDFITMNPIQLGSTDYQYGLPSHHGNEAEEPSSKQSPPCHSPMLYSSLLLPTR